MTPLNKHVMIEPIEVEDFVRTSTGLYQEIGTVVAVAEGVDLKVGSVVYFDAWLAKKYPSKEDSTKHIWFVSYEDLVAYEA